MTRDWAAVNDLGPEFAQSDLCTKEDWQSRRKAQLSMNASEFIYGSLHLLDPTSERRISPQGVALRQFTTRWKAVWPNFRRPVTRRQSAYSDDDTAIAGWSIRCRKTGSSYG